MKSDLKKSQKQVILDFLKKEMLGVVATIDPDSNPEAAVVAISQSQDLDLIFQTPNYTRKYENLKRNPKVAVVIGWDANKYTTIQYEGVAREAKKSKFEWCKKIHNTKNPKTAKFADISENKFFIVKPTWIRYWDYKTDNNFIWKPR